MGEDDQAAGVDKLTEVLMASQREQHIAELLDCATEAADMLEAHFRMALGFASKAEKDREVKKHAVLAPLRQAIKACRKYAKDDN